MRMGILLAGELFLFFFGRGVFFCCRLFDNAGTATATNESTSRGIKLNVNTSAMSVTLDTEYLPFVSQISQSQGNVQVLSNGNVMAG